MDSSNEIVGIGNSSGITTKEAPPWQQAEPPENLFDRFKHIRSAVVTTLVDHNPNGKSTNEDHRYGDEPIIFHNRKMKTIINDRFLSFTLKGDTYRQTTWIGDENDSRLQKQVFTDLFISGNFISRDGREGAFVIITFDFDIGYEAYWLECKNKNARYLRLEQIITPTREVIDTGRFDTGEDDLFFVPNWYKEIVDGQNERLVYIDGLGDNKKPQWSIKMHKPVKLTRDPM